jgi:hypothetical protein
MKNFEDFKASREKMDPSARKMTEHQWEQAYAAYCSSRERARGASSSSREGEGSRRSRRSEHAGSPGARGPSAASTAVALKTRIRAESAYAELRLIVNLLAWIIIGAIVILGLLQMSIYTSPAAVGVALLQAGIHLMAVIVLRLIAQALIDIPDVALHRICHSGQTVEGTEQLPGN